MIATQSPPMVNKKPKGLGMGLEALLGPKAAEPGTGNEGVPTMLALDKLQAGAYQPRTRMDEGSLYELAESIKSQGVMQPVLVRPVGAAGAGGSTNGRYEIIAGERRVRAARLAGLTQVPVLVKPVADEAAAVMALIENIQREDLNPLEEAQGLQRLVSDFGLTHEQAAQAVGRSRTAATNLLRLLKLAPAVQQMLMAGDIDMGHARALLPLPAAQQAMLAQQVSARQLSVRDTERLAARAEAAESGTRPATRTASADRSGAPDKASRDIARLEQRLSDHLTAPVQIRVKKRGSQHAGEVALAFGSLDELNGLLARLGLADS